MLQITIGLPLTKAHTADAFYSFCKITMWLDQRTAHNAVSKSLVMIIHCKIWFVTCVTAVSKQQQLCLLLTFNGVLMSLSVNKTAKHSYS